MNIPSNLIANNLPVVWALLNVIVELLLQVKSPSSSNLNWLLEKTTTLDLSVDSGLLIVYVFPEVLDNVLCTMPSDLINSISSECAGADVNVISEVAVTV